MSKHAFLAFLLVMPLLLSCGRPVRKAQTVRQERRTPELLSAVPSDALAVLCFDRCEDGMRYYDSTGVLHKLDLSAFRHNRMALSLCYSGSLMPILALDTGRAESDSLSMVNALIAQAGTLKLHTRYFPPDKEAGKRGFLVISPSDAQITAVHRHVSEYTSILDAPDFRQALAAAGGDDFIIFRNSGAERLAPQGWMKGIFPRREMLAFLRTVSEWTVLTPEAGGLQLTPVQSGSEAYFANILGSLPFGESRLDAVLPPQTRFALALNITLPDSREAFERYQDASVKLTRYRKTLAALKSESGKDPLLWEKELGIREVALVHLDGSAVTLVRPQKAVPDSPAADNPWRGFLPALYGNAFALTDDSFTACLGGWRLFGSEADVNAFLAAERPEGSSLKWPGKGCRFVLYEPEKTLAWGKKGIKLTWNSNQ